MKKLIIFFTLLVSVFLLTGVSAEKMWNFNNHTVNISDDLYTYGDTFGLGGSTVGNMFTLSGNNFKFNNIAGSYGWQLTSNQNRLTSVGGTARYAAFADSAGDFMYVAGQGPDVKILRDLNVTNGDLYVNGTIYGASFDGVSSLWNESGSNIYPYNLSKNVGIGTTSPNEKLHIDGGAGNGVIYLESAATGQSQLLFGATDGKGKGAGYIKYSDNSDLLLFGTNSTDRMTILSNGNVGIGTTSPDELLHVSGGNILFDNGYNLRSKVNSGTVANVFGSDATDMLRFGSGGWDSIRFDVGGAAGRMFIDNIGRVGINTVTPQNTLNVVGDLNVTGTIYGTTSGGDSLWNESGSNIYPYNLSKNVGIGTSSPSYKLDVVGNINIDGTSAYYYDGVNALRLDKGTDSYYSNTYVGNSAGSPGTQRQTSVGYRAGNSNTGGYQISLGWESGYQNSGGSQIALGNSAGNSNIADHQSVVGTNAGYQNSGYGQAGIGYFVGAQNSGLSQSALGYLAGQLNEGDYEVALGYSAGVRNKGDYSIGIGYEATYNNTVNNVVALGYRAGKDNTLANQFILQQANINAVPLIQGDFATGEVGIGLTNPSTTFEVRSTNDPMMKVSYNDNLYSYINFNGIGSQMGSSTNEFVISSNSSAAGGGDIAIKSSNIGGIPSTKLFIEGSNGNVGIGTDTPDFKLQVEDSTDGDGTWTGGINIKNTGATAGEAAISFQTTGTAGTGSNYWIVGANQDNDLNFNYGPNFQDGNNLMVITETGAMGIGDTTPDAKLDVNGDITVNGAVGSGLKFTTNGETSSDHMLTTRGGSSWLYLRNWADSGYQDMALGTLYAADSVGIGNSGPSYALDVTGTIRGTSNLIIGSGGYIDDDTSFGENVDDWIRLNGYIELKSNTDNYGIVLRDKDTTSYMGITQVGGYSYFADSTSYANYFLRGDGTNARIAGDLVVAGDVSATNYLYNSDEKFKMDIKKIDSALEDIKKLEGIEFKWKENGDKSYGLIAQEVEKVYPELVKTQSVFDEETNETETYKAVQYGNLVAPLIESVKELDQKDSELEKKIEEQEKRIEEQDEKIEELINEINLLKEKVESK